MVIEAAVINLATGIVENVIIIKEELISTFLADKGKYLTPSKDLGLQIGDTYDGTTFYRGGVALPLPDPPPNDPTYEELLVANKILTGGE